MINEVTKEELEERIIDAIKFLETEYDTYPSGEEWRKALKKVLKGENKIKKLKLNDSDIWTGKSDGELIVDKINEIIYKLNKMEENK